MSDAKEKRPPPKFHPQQRLDEDGNRLPRPTWPRPPEWVPRRETTARARLKTMAYVDGPREPLEVLSRLAGASAWKEPSVGRSTKGRPIGVDDIAHALGFVSDPLAQRLALAVACQTDAEWLEIQRLAYPRILAQLQGGHLTRAMVRGYRRYRIRIVLYDAFYDAVMHRGVQGAADRAKRAHMRMADYLDMYDHVMGFIETQAASGAFEAYSALTGRR